MLTSILDKYGLKNNDCEIQPFGNGLINSTWKIKYQYNEYILQRINKNVFKQPQLIAENITRLNNYLKRKFPDYLFVTPINTVHGQTMVQSTENDFFRLFPFVKNSHTVDVLTNPLQAFQAARQFGMFTQKLCGFNVNLLKTTLPNFHNLTLRYQQFEKAIISGNPNRIKETTETIILLKSYKYIVTQFEQIKKDSNFKIRVTHHDTKISNVLFNKNNEGLCVIDLDTVMPGYFFSDVGDMLRTYLSPVNEEETDFSKISIRLNYFEAIKEGYLNQMNDELTFKEKQHFIFAGKFMIYMQALRFFTDYICNDIYYGSKYEGHNLIRAKNQLVLLQKLIELENNIA